MIARFDRFRHRKPLLVLIQNAMRLKLALTNLRDFSGPVPEPTRHETLLRIATAAAILAGPSLAPSASSVASRLRTQRS